MRGWRGHTSLAIFRPFGSKPDGGFWETEEFVVNNLARSPDANNPACAGTIIAWVLA